MSGLTASPHGSSQTALHPTWLLNNGCHLFCRSSVRTAPLWTSIVRPWRRFAPVGNYLGIIVNNYGIVAIQVHYSLSHRATDRFPDTGRPKFRLVAVCHVTPSRPVLTRRTQGAFPTIDIVQRTITCMSCISNHDKRRGIGPLRL